MKEIFSLFSSRDAVVLILSGSHGNLEGRKNQESGRVYYIQYNIQHDII